jgi:hypothetical protein
MDLNDRAVIHQVIHCHHRYGAGGEDVLPLAERLVACDQQGSALVAVHHKLKQNRGLGLVLADLVDVINHEQGISIKLVGRLAKKRFGYALRTLRHELDRTLSGVCASRVIWGLIYARK